MPVRPRRPRLLALVALVACASVLAGALRAADAPPPSSMPKLDDATVERLLAMSSYTETSKVRMVLLPTTVTDRRGRLVMGLEQDDFVVYEGATPQPIQFFASDDSEPVTLVFMLDLSGSMRFLGKIDRAKDAIRYLVGSLDGEDQFGLIGFADSQVSWITDLGRDRRAFLRRLTVQEGYGQTALHDAVAAAPALVNDAVKGRKAIVLFTDGVDNASQFTIRQAIDIARRVSVPIYTIGFSSVPAENLPQNQPATQLDVLRQVSEETGGRLFLVDEEADLGWAVSLLDAELRHQYVLGYYPSERVKPGRFQSIRVEVVRKQRFDVRTRSGFVLTP